MRKRRPYRLLRVRLDPSLHKLLASSAQGNERSINGEIVYCLRKQLEKNRHFWLATPDEAPLPCYGWKEHEAAVAAWEKMVSAG